MQSNSTCITQLLSVNKDMKIKITPTSSQLLALEKITAVLTDGLYPLKLFIL